jgi:hypothetical protein
MTENVQVLARVVDAVDIPVIADMVHRLRQRHQRGARDA